MTQSAFSSSKTLGDHFHGDPTRSSDEANRALIPDSNKTAVEECLRRACLDMRWILSSGFIMTPSLKAHPSKPSEARRICANSTRHHELTQIDSKPLSHDCRIASRHYVLLWKARCIVLPYSSRQQAGITGLGPKNGVQGSSSVKRIWRPLAHVRSRIS